MFAPMVRYDAEIYDIWYMMMYGDVWWYMIMYDDVWWYMIMRWYIIWWYNIFSVPLTSEDATATGWIGSSAARQDRTLSVLNCKVTFNCLQVLPSSSSSLAQEQALFQPLPNNSWGQGPPYCGWGSERSWDEVSSGSGCTQLRATNRWSVSWLSKVHSFGGND